MTFERIVIKLGTSTLTAGTSCLSPPRLIDLVRQMWVLHSEGNEVILVSSGAIATGREALDFPQLPKNIPAKQMLAAIGQPRLMALYEQLFRLYDLTVAQVLLSRTDMDDRRRYLNARNTLNALLSHQIIPIVNENDTVATEEIRLGDNDNLSGLVANLIEADLLIMLTDQPGLFTIDPRLDSSAELITEVSGPEIPEKLWRAAGGTTNGLGTGGMITKLQAAELARRSGAMVVIAHGGRPNILLRTAAGEAIGTRIYPLSTILESRKRFILACGSDSDYLRIDKGAVQALNNGSSLLPVGVNDVVGDFGRGDTVRIEDNSGRMIARGLTNYAACDLTRIKGHQSEEIEEILGFAYGDEVVHRNNMVLLC